MANCILDAWEVSRALRHRILQVKITRILQIVSQSSKRDRQSSCTSNYFSRIHSRGYIATLPYDFYIISLCRDHL